MTPGETRGKKQKMVKSPEGGETKTCTVHRCISRFKKQNIRGLKKTAKVFPKKSLFFEGCFYTLPFTQNFHHEAKNSRHRHRAFGHYCA